MAIVDGRVYDAALVRARRLAPAGAARAALGRARRAPSAANADTAGGEVRYVAVPITGEGVRGTFVVLSALGGERDEVTDAVRVAAVVLVSVLLLAAALAWVLAGRILAPLRELRETARSITQTDLTRRIPVTGSDEIAELARTFNAMLDRLEASFASMESSAAGQRAFVSDASHELRTPITIVRGHLELLGDDPEERRETVALVTDELDRMSRFVDDLLLLAKAEREDFLHVAPLELGALTDELLDKATALGRRDWRLEARGERLLHGDRQRLTQAVMGLAQNAVEHTREGDPIWLGSAADGGEARLWVRDAGPGRAARRPRADLRALRQGTRQRAALRGRGARALDRARDRGGARRPGRARGGEGQGATFTVVLPAPSLSPSR